MAGPLESFFLHDVKCSAEDLERVAAEARERMPEISGSPDDVDEDLVVRLRDARAFGTFVVPLLEDRAISGTTHRALAAYAFDLLPIPRDEREAFLVAARAPPGLLAIASSLGSDLTTEYVLHLVYAVYLDRSLVTIASEVVRRAVLHAILGSGERLAALYATMHLAAVPEDEGARTLRAVLKSSEVPSPTKRRLRQVVVGGPEQWLELAQEEGLLPQDLAVDDPGTIANTPHVPESVRRAAR